jgi:hypothetical protein
MDWVMKVEIEFQYIVDTQQVGMDQIHFTIPTFTPHFPEVSDDCWFTIYIPKGTGRQWLTDNGIDSNKARCDGGQCGLGGYCDKCPLIN